MPRLIVVSNRVQTPNLSAQSPGGLAIGILGALKRRGGLWFGWSGKVTTDSERKISRVHEKGIDYITLDLSHDEYTNYYTGFSNGLLWPLCHYAMGFVHYDRKEYEGYLKVNRLFAKNLVQYLEKDDLIWIHDYHLFPLAHQLRQLGVKNRIGFFLHVPFPCYEMLRSLPIAKQLLFFLANYDVVGFQTEDDLKAYHDATLRSLDARLESRNRLIVDNNRSVDTGCFPIGVDVESIQNAANRGPDISLSHLTPRNNGKLIIGADRLDYSKGLLERIAAYRNLLKCHKELHHLVTLLQVITISRDTDPNYIELRLKIENQIARINGKYADLEWIPIHYLNRSLSHNRLMQVFRQADVCTVTSLRDGMNLVSKEYVSAQDPSDPGVLVLSELAGSAKQLDGALLVNPYDVETISETLWLATNMSREERIDRHQISLNAVLNYDIQKWRDNFIQALVEQPTEKAQTKVDRYALAC